MLLVFLFLSMLIVMTTRGDFAETKYDVTVYTGDQTFAGTQAKITIEFFGRDGETVTKDLPQDSSTFQISSVDEFKLDLGRDIGDITKIIISHDNTGDSPGWFLNKVEVQHDGSSVKSTFIGGRWLQKSLTANNILSIEKKEEEDCGQSSSVQGNKTESEPNQWPWVVQIKVGTTYCTGTLVHPQWALTSAQCTMGKKSSSIKIRLGEFDLTRNDYTEQETYGKEIETYPDYYPYTIEGDLSLIKLKSPAKLDSYVQVACLLESEDSSKNDSPCYMAGWGGGNSKKNKYTTLHQLRMFKLSTESCQKEVNKSDSTVSLTSNMFCYTTQADDINECIGDLGSPLMCETTTEKYTTYGYMSWTDPTCDEKNTVFTNIAKYRNWIEKTIYSQYIFNDTEQVNIDDDDFIVNF